LYLIGAFFLLLSDLNLNQTVTGLQEIQPNILLKLLFTFITFLSIYSIKSIYLNNIRSIDYLFYILFIFIGSCSLFSFNDFLMIFLALEILSLSSYVLVAYDRKSIASSEAGIKYLILGGISTVFFLIGVALIYFYLGMTNLTLYAKTLLILTQSGSIDLGDSFLIGVLIIANLFLITSLLFKLGAAPFHFWLADIYEGAPAAVGFFLAIVPKLSIFLLLVKLFEILDMDYNYLLVVVYLSLILGSFLALIQKKTKRFIAYSSVSHIGFALLPVISGIENFVTYTLIYFMHYILISFILWLFILIFFNAQNRKVRNLIELSSAFFIRPILAFCFAFIMLSLAGVPPFIGFWAKFWAIFTITEIQAYFLVCIVLLTSFVAIQYYIKLLKLIFYEDANLAFYTPVQKASAFSLGFLLILLFFYSLAPFVYMESISVLTWLKGFYQSLTYTEDYQNILLYINNIDAKNLNTMFCLNVQPLHDVCNAGFKQASALSHVKASTVDVIFKTNSYKIYAGSWVSKFQIECLLTQDMNMCDDTRLLIYEQLINLNTIMTRLNLTSILLDNTFIEILEDKAFIFPVEMAQKYSSLFDLYAHTLHSVSASLKKDVILHINVDNLTSTINAIKEFHLILDFTTKHNLSWDLIYKTFNNLKEYADFINSLSFSSETVINNSLKLKFK